MSKRDIKPPEDLRWELLKKICGEIYIPFSVTIPAVAPRDESRPATHRGKPTRDQLPELVDKAQSVITFNGGTPTRPAPKRQHIDALSYSYGVLWGVACALDCSLREVLTRYATDQELLSGQTDK